MLAEAGEPAAAFADYEGAIDYRRPKFQGVHKAADPYVLFTQTFVEAFHQGIPALKPGADDHQLGVERVLQLLVQRQVETNRAFADV